MTKDEKSQLAELAAGVNLKLSEYVYFVAMNRKVRVVTPSFKRDISTLIHISNNLNQLARDANKYHYLNEEQKGQLDKCLDSIYKTLTYEL